MPLVTNREILKRAALAERFAANEWNGAGHRRDRSRGKSAGHLAGESTFRDMLIEREKVVKQQLAIYMKNLNRLQIQKAQYGLDFPTHLANEIEYTHEQIDRLMKELQGQEGILPVLKALSRSESIDRMLQGNACMVIFFA